MAPGGHKELYVGIYRPLRNNFVANSIVGTPNRLMMNTRQPEQIMFN